MQDFQPVQDHLSKRSFYLQVLPPNDPGQTSIFTSEWTNPEGGYTSQLTSTWLLQEFKNSQTLLDGPLSVYLLGCKYKYLQRSLLHNVDNILAASITEEEYRQATKELLETFKTMRYIVSAKRLSCAFLRSHT